MFCKSGPLGISIMLSTGLLQTYTQTDRHQTKTMVAFFFKSRSI